MDSRLTTGQPGNPLQAWDAADRALLAAVDATCSALAVVGERWGALVVPLADRVRSVLIDSAAGRAALTRNLTTCEASVTDQLRFGDVSEEPDSLGDLASPEPARWPCGHDGVLMRASPSVALFDWQLSRLGELAPVGAPVWIAALANQWSNGHERCVASRLGASRLGASVRSRGVGKARVVQRAIQMALDVPTPWTTIPGPTGFALASVPGVFCHGRIDPGARSLLAALPSQMAGQRVVDLGCGNGVMGVEAAARGAAAVIFTDDSLRALAAARRTWLLARQSGATARFAHADAGAGLPAGEADLVICNPPFHQDRAQTLHIVDAMLLASRRLLRRGGQLVMVGNRHLHHESRATSVLSGVKIIHDDGRFSVLRARR